MKDLFLLSAKPILYAANVGESDVTRAVPAVEAVREIAARKKPPSSSCPAGSRRSSRLLRRTRWGVPGLDGSGGTGPEPAGARGVPAVGAYQLLYGRRGRVPGLAGGGERPLEAAGEIHSDIARGFIRAEVMSYEDLIARGSETAVREAGSSGSRERDTRSATATWSISGSMCDPRKAVEPRSTQRTQRSSRDWKTHRPHQTGEHKYRPKRCPSVYSVSSAVNELRFLG